ncbi:hypothetical protein GQ53DRAFT_858827, partial [Thozetella sp. PMI_491]
MSDALAPTGGSDFSQQGSLDWVSLSKSSYNFALDLLVRLEHAGLSPATLVVASVASRSLTIKADAQKRLLDALSRLPSFSSYGKLVWFGFGIKPILMNLVEREEGIACVGLCACLSVSYDSFYAAKVLRELCIWNKAPPQLIPSIHQWKKLVEICAGSLSASNFPLQLEGILRLVQPRTKLAFDQPTSERALAGAITALAGISSGKLRNVTITGGLDCLWLATAAQWLLSLDVEVCLSTGTTVYSSSQRIPSIKVIFESGDDRSLLLNHAVVVPKGEKLWRRPHQDELLFRGGSAEWEAILVSSFGSRMDALLLQGGAQRHFARFLRYVSGWAETYYHYGPFPGNPQRKVVKSGVPFGRFHFGRKNSRGDDFLRFARSRLPELVKPLDLLDSLPCSPVLHQDSGINDIAEECMCCRCRKSETTDAGDSSQLCISSWEQRWKVGKEQHFPTHEMDILAVSVMVFSGSAESLVSDGQCSALSRQGICAFFVALEEINSPPTAVSTVRVLPGHIELEDRMYDRVCDLKSAMTVPHGYIGPRFYELLAQESRQPGSIDVGYSLSFDLQSYSNTLGVSALVAAIAERIWGPFQCRNQCGQRPPEVDKMAWVSTLAPTINFTPGWSLISVPNSDKNDAIEARIIQATFCELYYKIAQEDKNYHLIYINICCDCLTNFLSPFEPRTDDSQQCSQLGSSRALRMKGTVTITRPSANGCSEVEFFEITIPRLAGELLPQSPDLEHAPHDIRCSAVHSILSLGRTAILQLLLQGGANPNSTMETGKTPLFLTAEHHAEAKILLSRGGRLEEEVGALSFKSLNYFHSLSWITVPLLLDFGALSRESYSMLLILAAADGQSFIIERLLQEKTEVNTEPSSINGRTALQAAAEGGYLAIVETLLYEKAEVNATPSHDNGRTALQ